MKKLLPALIALLLPWSLALGEPEREDAIEQYRLAQIAYRDKTEYLQIEQLRELFKSKQTSLELRCVVKDPKGRYTLIEKLPVGILAARLDRVLGDKWEIYFPGTKKGRLPLEPLYRGGIGWYERKPGETSYGRGEMKRLGAGDFMLRYHFTEPTLARLTETFCWTWQ
jgi:hypothetical protein